MRIRTYGVVRGVMQNIRLLDCFFQTAWNQHGLKAVPSEAAAVHSHICLAFNVHRSHDLSYGARQAAEALLILIE